MSHKKEQGKLADQLSDKENTMSGRDAMEIIGDKMKQLKDSSRKKKELDHYQRLEEQERLAKERQSSGNE